MFPHDVPCLTAYANIRAGSEEEFTRLRERTKAPSSSFRVPSGPVSAACGLAKVWACTLTYPSTPRQSVGLYFLRIDISTQF